MPAILEEYEPRLEAWHREDMLVRWEIARPGTDGTNNFRIEAMLREPGVAAGRAQLDALIASIRIDAAASPSPSAATTQPEAAGLRVMSVSEAVAIRDAGVDDHEIAVRGWYAAHAPERACGRQLKLDPVSPLQVRCPDQLLWLTQDREQLTTTTDTSTSWRGPTGLAISPHFDDVDMAWADPAADPFRPRDLVLIGHFDDRGSGLCPAAEELACRDQFVVDRVDSVDGVDQPLSIVDRVDGTEASTAEDVPAAVHKTSLGRPILSIVIADARSEGFQGGPSATVWVVRVLGDQVVEHHVVFDGTDEVFEVIRSLPPEVAGPPDSSAAPRDDVLGMPVISVPELIARHTRSAPPTPEEVAVRGWMVRSNVVYDCALPDIEPHPLVPAVLGPDLSHGAARATYGTHDRWTIGDSAPGARRPHRRQHRLPGSGRSHRHRPLWRPPLDDVFPS